MIKKIVLAIFVSNILLNNFYLVFSMDASIPISPKEIVTELDNALSVETSKSPSGKKIEKLKSLVEESLVEINNWYGRYEGNVKYNEIIEREIKLIIKETYEGNEEFYNELFLPKQVTYRNEGDYRDLADVLSSIPKSTGELRVSKILFNSNFVTDSLLEASFGLGYDTSSYDSFLESLKRIIENFKRNNGYYPSIEELGKERIYNNFKEVSVSEVLDEIDYKINYKGIIFQDGEEEVILSDLSEAARFLEESQKADIEKDIENIRNGNIDISKLQAKYINLIKNKDKTENGIYIDMYAYISSKYLENSTYTLEYKDITYTYEQALAKNKAIERKKATPELGEITDRIPEETTTYKDYKELIGDTEIKDIPEIYKNIPSDAMFFHISNPEFIFQLLESKNTLVNSSSGLQILKKLKDLSMLWFDIDDWDTIRENLKHEFIVVISDIDLSAPSIIVIIHKEDAGVLVPGKKPKVAVTVGEYIYIASSEKTLDKFTGLKEINSIYRADDFRYVWMKKQNMKKDVFFFVGDKFFENIISFDNYIKMKRKINDYMNLYDLQNYVWGYEKLTNKKLDNFKALSNILDIEEKKLDRYTINQSIVTDKKIGELWDSINVNEVDYDLSSISREELKSYQENILRYKELWRSSLDPLGIIINSTDAGFEIDFFMTPIPNIEDRDFQLLITLFSGLGLEELDFIKNPKLRIGSLGAIFGIDMGKTKEKLSSISPKKNSEAYYFQRGLAEFNEEVLGGDNFMDYIDGEFMLSFGGIDESILSAWDAEKLDVFLAIEFKSKLKAKEFIKKLRDLVVNKMGGNYGSSMENKMYSALIKPIVEDYKGEDVYIIPFPDFYFPITFYYTILDNYFYISISKVSIQKTIDHYVSDDQTKSKFANDNYLDGTKLLYGFLDADNIKSYIESALTSDMMEDIYIELKGSREISQINPIILQISKFYHDVEYSNLMGEDLKPLDEKIGILDFKSKGDVLYLKINKDELNITNQDILDDLDSMFESIDSKYFQGEGADISDILKEKGLFENLVFIGIFDTLIDQDFVGNLFTNMSFSFDVGDNEIQLKMNAFKGSKSGNSETVTGKNGNGNDEVDSGKGDIILGPSENGKKFMNDRRTYMAFGVLVLVVLIAMISTALKGRKKK